MVTTHRGPTSPRLQSSSTGSTERATEREPDQQAAPQEAAPEPAAHLVKKGDTLTSIARSNNTTVAKLLELNPDLRQNPNRLRIGQSVTLPSVQRAPVTAETQQQGRARAQSSESLARARVGAPEPEVAPPPGYRWAPSIDEVVAGQNLEIGHKGPAVAMMQQALNKLGANPPVKVDGFFGPKSMTALKEAQRRAGVDPTEIGRIGPSTLEKLNERLSPEDVDKMRDRAVAMYAVSRGNVPGVAQRSTNDITDADVDRALSTEEWTPEQQANVGAFKPMSQSDYNQRLGNGRYTIRQSGCMLTAYAMAATGLTGRQDLNPSKANTIVKNAGGFSGGSLIGPTAARALGIREVERTGTHRTSARNLQSTIDRALASGKAVVLGVDYKAGSRGTSNGTGVDHWITITGKDAQGNYTAIDPVGGRQMTLRADANGTLVGRGWASGTKYVGKEAAILTAD